MGKINLRLCLTPDLFRDYYRAGDVVIVVDLLRATTTINSALLSGIEWVLPVGQLEECQRWQDTPGVYTLAERGGERLPFARFGNDPLSFEGQDFSGIGLVMTTTNGTRALRMAADAGAEHIYTGALSNLTSLSQHLLTSGYSNILVLASGWQGEPSLEDSFYAGALASQLQALGGELELEGYCQDMYYLWQKGDAGQRLAVLRSSSHYHRLLGLGLEESAEVCFRLDTAPIAVKYCSQEGRLFRLY